jgi:hypothetical protein
MRDVDSRFDLSDTPDWSPRRRRGRAQRARTEDVDRELDEFVTRLAEEDRRPHRNN